MTRPARWTASADDPRIGCELCSFAYIAQRRNQAIGSVRHMVKGAQITPAAVVEISGQYLYDRGALPSAGIWPDRPIDRRRESWLPVYARRRGLPEAHVEEILCRYLGHRLGLPTLAKAREATPGPTCAAGSKPATPPVDPAHHHACERCTAHSPSRRTLQRWHAERRWLTRPP